MQSLTISSCIFCVSSEGMEEMQNPTAQKALQKLLPFHCHVCVQVQKDQGAQGRTIAWLW